MSEAPLRKDPPDTARLEDRMATLEEGLARVNAFNNEVTKALQHVLEQLRDLVTLPVRDLVALPEHTQRLQQKFENYRAVEALGRASKIFPKSRSVVFVSKGYFGDNVKYAYLAFYDYARSRDIAVHFLTDDPHQRDLLKAAGLPCLSGVPEDWSREDIRALFGAKVVVLGDNFHPYSYKSPKAFGMLRGAKTIQMWHGIPIKEIGLRYFMRADKVIIDELLASAGEFDMFVAPGGAAREEWAQRFAFRDFAATGYPRNDIFFREPAEHDLLNVDKETYALFEAAGHAGQPAILYAPTFRDDPGSGWFGKAKVEALAAHAGARGYMLALNLHPYEQNKVEEFRQRYPGIRFVAPGTDAYPIVRRADVLITDYSSLAFDYLLRDRPLIFYRPDHDDYMKSARGFIAGNECLTPGAVATTMDELLPALDAAANCSRAPGGDPHQAARRDLRAKLFDHIDGNAAKRLCEVIVRMVEE